MMDAPQRILYIEDDEALGRLTQKSLGRLGFDVSVAISSDAGLALLRAGGFDAIALDHHLPGRDGLQTLALIAELDAPPPVVFATGSDESRVAVAALKAGAADYVIKDTSPSYFQLLAKALTAAIEATAVRRARDAAQAEIRVARDRAEMLLKEVNHRVANSLAMVNAMAHMQAQALSDPAAREALAEMQRRIDAIAQVHRRLYTSGDVSNVDLKVYLEGLVAQLNESVGDGRVQLAAVPADIATDKAVSLGVIVNELVSNACKYAYPAGGQEPVRVKLERHAPDRLRLSVEDDGVGWTGSGKIQGTGVGGRVVKAMATSLRTSLAYEPRARGTTATLVFAA